MKLGRVIIGSALLLLVAGVMFVHPGNSVDREQAAGRNAAGAQPSAEMAVGEVIASDPVVPVLVGPARDLPPYEPEAKLDREINPRVDHSGLSDPAFRIEGGLDPLLAVQAAAPEAGDRGFETPIFNFEGQGYSFLNPPDTVGDIGVDHYVQMINATSVAVYDKDTGLLVDSFDLGSLGGCTTGSGDPIVLYDHEADRWLLSEFGPGFSLCVLISQSPDPAGSYYSYQFSTPSFPDYPKYGVWPDAYYVTTNESSPASYALDRDEMLAGQPATSQRFTAPGLPGFGFEAMTPADMDGPTLPPAGSPNYIMRHRDTEAHGPAGFPTEDFLEVWAFDVDWANPGNSSFTQVANISVTEFDSDICGLTPFFGIPMPGVPKCNSSSLDPLREVVMFRLQYRNFGAHETLVGNLVTDVTGNDDAGVRWFELRKAGAGAWALYQEGTYAPDGDGRWMGAIAMDGAGNIALGYNVSGSATFPSLRYAGRLAGDPLGTLPQGEYDIVDGSASNGSNRYGDYSAMSVDPVDDCTFWFTGEYNPASQWSTRIAAFRFDACGEPGYAMSTTPTSQAICAPDDALYTVITTSIAGYTGDIDLTATGNPGTATFVPNPVAVGDDSILTISGAGAGNYTFDVEGDSGGIMRTNTVSLDVYADAPAAPALASPPNGATNVPLAPTYTWNPAANAISYFIEVATDAGFTNVVDSATVAGTTYNGIALAANSTYYWRVTADNPCGGSSSATWIFTTADLLCSTPNLAIPDNNPTGVTNDLVVGSGGTIDDLNVSLDVSHTWVGDVVFRLEHVDTGTVVTFYDRPGVPASTFGCSGNDIDASLNDEGTDGNVEAECGAGVPSIEGDFVGGDPPNTSLLAAFDGEAIAGTWRLTAIDLAGGDTGTVNEWCIDAAVTGGDEPDIEVDPTSMSSTQNSNTVVVQQLDVSNVGTANLLWTIDEVETVLTGAGGSCDAPTDIPWLMVNPNAGSTPPAGTTSVDVTFDSTGYAAGTYTGDLCVFSNDPDEELVVVPVEMIVEQPTDVGVTGLSGVTGNSLPALTALVLALVLIAGFGLFFLRRSSHR